MFLEISRNSQENTCFRVSFLIKLQAETFNFIKIEALAQVFSCEFFEISKNTFFTEHLQEIASCYSHSTDSPLQKPVRFFFRDEYFGKYGRFNPLMPGGNKKVTHI